MKSFESMFDYNNREMHAAFIDGRIDLSVM